MIAVRAVWVLFEKSAFSYTETKFGLQAYSFLQGYQQASRILVIAPKT